MPKKTIRIKLKCDKCKHQADGVLMLNEQGIYKMNDYLCGNCLIVMTRIIEIPLQPVTCSPCSLRRDGICDNAACPYYKKPCNKKCGHHEDN